MADRSPNPFKTPENYFDSIPDRVLERVHSESRAPIRQRNKAKITVRYWLGAAAVLTIGLFLWKVQTPAPTRADEQALEEYLAFQNISQYELIDGLSDEQIRALEISLFQPKNTDDEIH